MTQKEYKEKTIDKFVLKIYETNLYLQGRHLLYLIKPKNTESDDSRLLITYNVVDASQPTLLYSYYAEEGQEEYWTRGVDMFDKVEIDGTEVSVADLDAAEGMYQLNVGEHTVAYTFKDPTTIGTSAFERCSSLTSVTIPSSVVSIGEGAFAGCGGLSSVTIGDGVTGIGALAFRSCSGLTSVTIGNSVTSIGNNAFDGCSSLTSIEIPSSVTSIGDEAFCGCPLDSASATAINAINPNATRCKRA